MGSTAGLPHFQGSDDGDEGNKRLCLNAEGMVGEESSSREFSMRDPSGLVAVVVEVL
jgi:hypothetical protein